MMADGRIEKGAALVKEGAVLLTGGECRWVPLGQGDNYRGRYISVLFSPE